MACRLCSSRTGTALTLPATLDTEQYWHNIHGKDTEQLEFSSRKKKMRKVIDGTKVPHSIWKTLVAVVMNRRPPISAATDERQPSCFGLEEERGEDWKGSGAMKSVINDSRPSL